MNYEICFVLRFDRFQIYFLTIFEIRNDYLFLAVQLNRNRSHPILSKFLLLGYARKVFTIFTSLPFHRRFTLQRNVNRFCHINHLFKFWMFSFTQRFLTKNRRIAVLSLEYISTTFIP